MFTGIIEEVGTVSEFKKLSNGAKLKIKCKTILEDINIGDSISINGCCQTVTEIFSDGFAVDVSDETLRITTFKNLKNADSVNLERALTPTSRMGGHIVQGHVDGTGKFISAEKKSEFYDMTFEITDDLNRYIVKKGSISINGISLTVANINNNQIAVAVIPHTYQNTTMNLLKPNDIVNIETDVLGRYVEKFLSSRDNNSSNLTEDFLKENGFI
jgi:riboflavin synthase